MLRRGIFLCVFGCGDYSLKTQGGTSASQLVRGISEHLCSKNSAIHTHSKQPAHCAHTTICSACGIPGTGSMMTSYAWIMLLVLDVLMISCILCAVIPVYSAMLITSNNSDMDVFHD